MPIDAAIPLQVRPPQFTDPTQTLAGLQELRMRQQAIDASTTLTQERQVETQAKQRALEAQNTIGQLMQTAFTEDPDTGIPTFDRDKFSKGLVQAGLGYKMPEISESLDKMDASAASMAAARRKLIAQTIFTTQQNGATPQAVQMGIAYLRKQHAITDEHANAMIQAISTNQDPQSIDAVLRQIGSTLPEYRELQNAEETRQAGLAKTKAEAANLQASAAKTTTEAGATQRQQDAAFLAAATNPGDYTARRATLPAERQTPFPVAPSAWTPAFKTQIQQIGMTPEQQVTAANAAQNTAIAGAKQREEVRHDLALESFQDPTSPKRQDALEQQYRGILQKEFSSRSGGLGTEDQKVNQAIHLLTLFDQNKDAKGNYNLPPQLVSEAALGLARLTSPNGNVGVELESKMEPGSLKGDVSKALQYVTGSPQTGSTQELLQMLRDSIERQGTVAQNNREKYFDAIKAQAPTDLNADRKQKLEQSLALNRMPSGTKSAAGGFSVTAPNGKTYSFATQADLDAFKKNAGIQ